MTKVLLAAVLLLLPLAAQGATVLSGEPAQGGRERQRGRSLGALEQPRVRGAQLRRRNGAELVADQHAQALERLQRLGDVALRRLRVHQQRIPRLPVGRERDQAAARRVCGRCVAARERGAGEQLQGA